MCQVRTRITRRAHKTLNGDEMSFESLILRRHEQLFISELQHRIPGVEVYWIPPAHIPYQPLKQGSVSPRYLTPGTIERAGTVDEAVSIVVSKFGEWLIEPQHTSVRRLFYFYSLHRFGPKIGFAAYTLVLHWNGNDYEQCKRDLR
jgi:hypothetical protein